ncbi:MAG: sporulation protein [Actinomycetota bacterium]
MDARELTKAVREALSVRQVFGEPVERDGVTVIPAATVIGGGGGGGGEQPPEDGEAEPQSSVGLGFGGLMWPAGAFEIRGDRVTWRPAIDLTRVLLMALMLAIAVVRARSRRR